MAGWHCFMVHPTGFLRRELRRFSRDADKCATRVGCHDASTVVDAKVRSEHDGETTLESLDAINPDDRRWPTRCSACGKPFDVRDHYQARGVRLYGGFPDGVERALCDDLPIGAMWDATWLHGLEPFAARSKDGKVLILQTPHSQWMIDGSASNGPGWERVGVPPLLTVRPSIGQGKVDGRFAFHGWLTDGVLSECIDGNAFPHRPFTA